MMSQGEFLRRRMESMSKIIVPKPPGDSGFLTEIQRKRASRVVASGSMGPKTECCKLPRPGVTGPRDAGYQRQEIYSQRILDEKAGCAICAAPAQPRQIVVPCCPMPENPKGEAYKGRESCCPVVGKPPQLAGPKCCPGRGFNTVWANDVTKASMPYVDRGCCKPKPLPRQEVVCMDCCPLVRAE